jgi:transposase-like protein
MLKALKAVIFFNITVSLGYIIQSLILHKEFEEFQNRDLGEHEIEYLFLDAIYETLRARFGVTEAILCAWGITRDGKKVLLHLALGNKESYEDWLLFLRDMVKRGLRPPTTVTTDGAPGLIKAVEAVFPKSLRIRCLTNGCRTF